MPIHDVHMDRHVLSLKHTCHFMCVVVDGIAMEAMKVCDFDRSFKHMFACDDDHCDQFGDVRKCVV